MKKGIFVFFAFLLAAVIALLGFNHFYGDFLNFEAKFKKENKVKADSICPYDVKLCFLPNGSEKKAATFGVDEDFIQFEYYAEDNKTLFNSADCKAVYGDEGALISGGKYATTLYDCFLLVDNEIVTDFEAVLTFSEDYIIKYLETYNTGSLSSPGKISDYRLSTVFNNDSYKLLKSEHFVNYWNTYDMPETEYSMGHIEYWDYDLGNNIDEYLKRVYNGETVFTLSLSYYLNGECYYNTFAFNLDSDYISSRDFG